MGTDAFDEIYARLRAILMAYVPPLFLATDAPTLMALDLAPEGERSPSTWFGGVRLGKRYVSYYLLGVYGEPAMMETMSPELRKRMQGKSCFNFAKVDEALFAEIAQLTQASLDLTGGDPTWGASKRAERKAMAAAEGRTAH
jgi:hypothetical protein